MWEVAVQTCNQLFMNDSPFLINVLCPVGLFFSSEEYSI